MDPLQDIYAPPQEERVANDDAVDVAADPRAARVGGGLRVLATIASDLPVLALSMWLGITVYQAVRAGSGSFQLAPEAYRVIAAVSLLWDLIESACEIVLAASPGMLLFGLRVARADGSRPTTARLIYKALLVRVPKWPTVPATIAGAILLLAPRLGDSAVGAVAASSDGALHNIAMVFSVPWLIGWLFAFGARRQTHVDRMLDLAVFRKRDVR
ncbi:MAG: RDD family protein [Deltaproteobacteria bacterium]|nr:RDD family protein [Deltaproteobacteria bacterium]